MGGSARDPRHGPENKGEGVRPNQGLGPGRGPSTYDFTGQNVTSLKKDPKDNFLDLHGMCFGFSAPKIGRVLMKTFPKPSFTHSVQKNGPGGGGVYQISPDVALTTCIQLYSKSCMQVARVAAAQSQMNPRSREILSECDAR